MPITKRHQLRGALGRGRLEGFPRRQALRASVENCPGYPATQFPPRTARQSRRLDTEVDAHREHEQLAGLCLLTPSAKAGRMAPQ